MSDDLFSLSNRIALTMIAEGKPGTEELFALFRERDIELIEKMSAFGGPLSTGVGSAVSYEGDVVISSNQNLSGLHYYNTLTINSGVVVTATGPLIIDARDKIDCAGATITAVGYGAAGGVAGRPGADGGAGKAGAPGGGGGVAEAGGPNSYLGGAGGVGVNDAPGGLSGINAGDNAATVAALEQLAMLALLFQLDYTKLGGGGGGGGAHDVNSLGAGSGGNGGGIICISAPTVIFTGGTLTAAGASGANVNSGFNASGAGGGGGGVIKISTKSWLPPSVLSVAGGAGGVSVAQGDGASGANGVLQINIYA